MFGDRTEDAFGRYFSDSILTVDSHVGGEPARLVVGGLPPIPGNTTNDKRLYLSENLDHVRLLLNREPRGHRDMFSAVIMEPESEGAAFGMVYMDAKRYPYLCGHATIAAVSAFIELGLLEAQEPETEVMVDTPSGPWHTVAHVRRNPEGDGIPFAVDSVYLRPEPTFAYLLEQPLEVPGLGRIEVDVSFAGGFFVMVDAQKVGLELTRDNASRLSRIGMEIITAGNRQLSVRHPKMTYIDTIDVVEFYDPSGHAEGRGKNAVVLGEGHVDRSPCGSGTCAKLALLHKRGELKVGEPFVNEGLMGATFEARILGETTVGEPGLPAVLPEVGGRAHMTGLHRFIITPDDPYREGFLV